MKNADLFTTSPDAQRILNQGVAELSERKDAEFERVLRYELETFICEGQYKKGLDKILSHYLSSLASGAAEQHGIWISGFYGSGKTHLAKMLRVLWTDYRFSDGSTALGLVHLPEEIRLHFKELASAAERNGAGLFAASGKMGGGGSASVRLAVISILCKALGLPAQYALVQFILWLRDEGKLEQVRASVESAGKSLEKEIENLFVSPVIAGALRAAFPDSYQSDSDVREALRANFVQPADISDDELVKIIDRMLSKKGKFPLTLIVLDELQQYIGSDAEKAYQVQLLAEVCAKRFRSRLLIVGTGQSALADTPNLSKLLARFSVPVQLSENDVDRVIRRIILAKKPSAEPPLKAELERHHGEIARHLEGSIFAHTARDDHDLLSDYPLLPTRRRFWEHVLRTIDPTGTTAQVRNQLRVVNEAVVAVQNEELGIVVGGDFVFDQNAESLVASQAIDRETYTRILELSGGEGAEELLMGRLLKLVFLINKLPSEGSADARLRATPQAVSDLLVENLREDSAELRRQVPVLLERLVERHALMQIEGDQGTEYRLQTRESSEWSDEYRNQEVALRASASTIAIKRSKLLRDRLEQLTRSLCYYHGQSREPRRPELRYDSAIPMDYRAKLYVWIRDGSSLTETQALDEARALDRTAPTVVLYLPDEDSNSLFNAIIAAEAAQNTITARGMPGTPAGQEARKSIETRLSGATASIGRSLEAVIAGGRVWLAGGSEISSGLTLFDILESAVEKSVNRLYPRFSEADDKAWEKVLLEAKKGKRDALQALSYTGDPGDHPVCKTVLDQIGREKTGKEIRDELGAPPFGWSRDAIDGALMVLLASDRLVATDAGNHSLVYTAQTLDRAKIGQCRLRREDRPLTVSDRLALCSLYQQVGVNCKQQEVHQQVRPWLAAIKDLIARSGGAAPRPLPLASASIIEIEGLMGNEQLFRILEVKPRIEELIRTARARATILEDRMPRWQLLQSLLERAGALPGLDRLRTEVAAIETQRTLAAEADPVESLLGEASEIIRHALNDKVAAWRASYASLEQSLSEDPDWMRLPDAERDGLKAMSNLGRVAEPELSGPEALASCLAGRAPQAWDDLIDALPGRYERLRKEVVARLAPKAVPVTLPKRLIQNEAELETWLAEAKALIRESLGRGPVSL